MQNQTRRRRLGMLVPSSNTVLEPETAKLLPSDGSITTHVSRLGVTTISADDMSRGQFETDPFVSASRLLMDAKVDLILWNGTAASWLGFDWDARIVAAIESHTSIRATTAVIAINEQLAALNVRKLGLVTPYIASVESKIVANYAASGITVVSSERLDLTVNADFADVPPARIAAMARAVAQAKPEAIVIMCTNLAGAPVVDALQAELGIPIIDSIRAAIEHSCRLLA